jgi:hypothetical protein
MDAGIILGVITEPVPAVVHTTVQN